MILKCINCKKLHSYIKHIRKCRYCGNKLTNPKIVDLINYLKQPNLEFNELIEWQNKNRKTDSQLYNEGYEQALKDLEILIHTKSVGGFTSAEGVK